MDTRRHDEMKMRESEHVEVNISTCQTGMDKRRLKMLRLSEKDFAYLCSQVDVY